jgi:hypothetical protein
MNEVFSRLGEYNEVLANDEETGSGETPVTKRCLAACENQVHFGVHILTILYNATLFLRLSTSTIFFL